MRLEKFTAMAVTDPKASGAKDVARQLAFRQLSLTDASPFPEGGDLGGQWFPWSQTMLVFGMLDDACPGPVAQLRDMPERLEACNIRHAGQPEVTWALSRHLFSTASHGALPKVEWVSADVTTLRE